jgi:hypothetical protein
MSLQLLLELCKRQNDFAFNRPCSNSTIAALANEYSWDMPQDYREFLSATNGESRSSDGLCGGFRFLSVDEIREVHSEWSYYAENDFAELSAETWFLGESPFYDIAWIPIASLMARSLIMLASKNNSVLVFSWSVEIGPHDAYATSFTQLLNRIGGELLDGDDYMEMIGELTPIESLAG